MMRKFPYVTVGQILDELNQELRDSQLIGSGQRAITRPTFYRLENRLDNFPRGRRTSGRRPWRIYTLEEKETIKKLIKEEYWS